MPITSTSLSSVTPNFDGRKHQKCCERGNQHECGNDAEKHPADEGSGNRSDGHGEDESSILAQHGEALVTAVTAKATSIVDSETSSDRLPAIIMSTAKSR